tara:strand:- start:607 stop:1221 length:615 start_codon:yes stop_codon:yes gene_type:complete
MVIDQLRGGPAFATKEQRQIKSKDIYDIIQEKENKKLIEINTMKSVDNFGGRRFLGLTPKGKPVFVSFNINKTELRPNIKFSHNLSVLTKEGAKFANDRYMFKHNEKIEDYNIMVRKLKKVRGGEVTVKTLQWLTRLKLLEEMSYMKAFVKGKVTKYFFTLVSDAIYIGDEKLSKHMIQKYWKFPTTNNDYFLIENTWKYPDSL